MNVDWFISRSGRTLRLKPIPKALILSVALLFNLASLKSVVFKGDAFCIPFFISSDITFYD